MESVVISDVERFIELVEARPALYVKTLKEYADINVKRKLWQEVCMELVPNWGELSAENKIKYGQNIQQKWLNLRTWFSRELKAQKDVKSGQATPKRRRYIYFEKLLFLLPTLEQRTTEGNLPEEETAELGNADLEEVTTDTPTRPSCSTKRKRKIQHEDTTTIEAEILKALQQETDEDTHFALSLVPQLRSLSEDEKFEAKIEILRILQQIKRTRSLNFRSTILSQQFNYSSAAVVTTYSSSTSYIHPHISTSATHQYSRSNPEPQQSTYSIAPSPANTGDTIYSYISQFTPGSSASEEILEL